ncbi:NAD-dependent epimerase/dehydratase family protein [Blastopirellula sp. JC732]|uniref:NAD-dependent epimerase/dehydratase family protein n=1 Tax=Blastopirellula sediminis TaxID=2894196 RepID=A0A9X1MJP0_9BACT|nr:NAD-dependent epimerase/dehydratase family protein [Blastopirellula sediminis]MCC9608050.1 NAD-dependent epimerase/dehydratase family protein [Blastopirellula sediminis]MCC9627157.1 NAD-dependent epimerase/dehydratase family protein [Blastopirellula sediminis]
MPKVLVTGSSGLIGSQTVEYFDQLGWDVHGIDNNMRMDFFGRDGDTTRTLNRLQSVTQRFTHHNLDIRNRELVASTIADLKPDLLVHCAAQPSHDLAKDRPFDDFDINAGGTLTLLESVRQSCRDCVFVFMSTNKVYGDAPNEYEFKELLTRYDYARPEDYLGVNESCRVDASMHSLFGASKLAADVMVQEYGRYFHMPTVCFRGGCLTGSGHQGAEMHGFLAYLARATSEGRPYRIFGHQGKQVRDNIHSLDVCRAFHAFYKNPKCGAVYNLGGGRENSVSMLEAIDRFEQLLGKRLSWEYVPESRLGDHICYISDLTKFRQDYPDWSLTYSLEEVFEDIAERHRSDAPAGIAVGNGAADRSV